MTRKPWSPKYNLAFEYRETKAQTSKYSANLVSVCVTAYNYAQYLPECLESIADQTHRELELIIVDDKSEKDGTLLVAAGWAEKNRSRFARVCVVSHVRNQGPAEARNTAFSLAKGSYVFIIDADNKIYPRAIGRLFEAAKEGEFDATYSQLEVFGIERRIGLADIWDPVQMKKSNYVDVMAMVSRASWERVGGFSHIEQGWEDYDFWLKFVDLNLKVGYVPEILCRYRAHSDSRTYTEAHVAHEELKVLMALRHPN